MAKVDDLCLDNVDEFVNDENKRVTYKWLSYTLSLHVNQAKQLLSRFVNIQRNKKDNDLLSVSYVLSGLVEDNGAMAHRVQVVPEEKLEAAKAKFKVLTTCHIYSVQKGPLKDTNTLYMTDYESVRQHLRHSNQFSAIQCPWAEQRSEKQMEQFIQVQGSQTPAQLPKPASKPVAQKTSSKPAGIASMFAKSAAKPAKENKVEDSKPKESTKEAAKESRDAQGKEKSKAKGKPAGVMSFFGKQSVKPKAENEAKPAETKERKTAANENHSKKSPKTEDVEKKTPDAETKRGIKHKVATQDTTPKQKSRKRVRVQIESSSEDEVEDVDMESPVQSPEKSDPDIIPPSPDEKREPTPEPSSKDAKEESHTSEDTDTCGKIKRRKLVSKTSINDEGFMVTEKVYEDFWEDAPTESKPSPEKDKKSSTETSKSKKSSPPKKVSPTSKKSGKQMSLTSFFKKK